jgi:hypothetical protein
MKVNTKLKEIHEQFHEEFEELVSFDYFEAVYKAGRAKTCEEIMGLIPEKELEENYDKEDMDWCRGWNACRLEVIDKIKKLIK